MDQYHTETLGIALAGELTTFSLIGHLLNKGVLSKQEAVAIYEQTLMALEAYPQFDEAIQVARRILDQMAAIASKAPPRAPTP